MTARGGKNGEAVRPTSGAWDWSADLLRLAASPGCGFKPDPVGRGSGTKRGRSARRRPPAARHTVTLVGNDLFDRKTPYRVIDWVFAVMASSAQNDYMVRTAHHGQALAYLAHVDDLAPVALLRWLRAKKKQLQSRYKDLCKRRDVLTEDQADHVLYDTLVPARPTPQLRHVYDSATWYERSWRVRSGEAAGERSGSRDWVKPGGPGFSCGEYPYRQWPLTNVAVLTPDGVWRVAGHPMTNVMLFSGRERVFQ